MCEYDNSKIWLEVTIFDKYGIVMQCCEATVQLRLRVFCTADWLIDWVRLNVAPKLKTVGLPIWQQPTWPEIGGFCAAACRPIFYQWSPINYQQTLCYGHRVCCYSVANHWSTRRWSVTAHCDCYLYRYCCHMLQTSTSHVSFNALITGTPHSRAWIPAYNSLNAG